MNEMLPISTESEAVRKVIIEFSNELLSHGNNAGVIFNAPVYDPDCALGHALGAAIHLTRLTRNGYHQAVPLLSEANRLAEHATTREKQMIAAISAWASGDEQRAIRIFRAIVEDWPHDLIAAKFCQILEIANGDIPGMVRTSAMAAAAENRSGYALGLHGYALDQAGEAMLAEAFARRATELNLGRDPWAEHAVAHSYAAREMAIEGRAFLRSQSEGWRRCSSFMLTHNWWHLALFELQLHGSAAALELYDREIWGVRKNHTQDQINAISLLARLEMEGADVGDRWDDLASHAAAYSSDNINDFLDAHLAYALARNGRFSAVEKMIERKKAISGFSPSTARAVAIIRAVRSHARGEWLEAATAFWPFRGDFTLLGGSNIQRELFELLYEDAFARAGCFSLKVANMNRSDQLCYA